MGDQMLVSLGDTQVTLTVSEAYIVYLAFVPDLLLKIIIDSCINLQWIWCVSTL